MEHDRWSFNLIDEPWIWVRDERGERIELSLAEVFDRAHTLNAFANDLPTQDFAILRMLLAILRRAVIPLFSDFDDPAELWGELWSKRRLPIDELHAYLTAWHHRFDLFDASSPFMQVADLHTAKGTMSEPKKIVADVPDGKAMFTLRSGSSLDNLTFDESARWLVHAHAYDTSGIKSGVMGDPNVKGGKSYPTGTGWTGRIGGLYIDGDTLTETLLLNSIFCGDDHDTFPDENDLPAWERPQCQPGDAQRKPSGPADTFTWQSRRIRLVPRDGKTVGVVLTNGDQLEPHNQRLVEPMTSWRRSAPQERRLGISPVYMPQTHSPQRALWRGLDALLPLEKEDASHQPSFLVNWLKYLASDEGGGELGMSTLLRIHAVGFEYGSQSSTFAELIDDSLSMHAILLTPEGALLAHAVRTCLKHTDDAVRALGYLAQSIVMAGGGDRESSEPSRQHYMSLAFFELDRAFRTWLSSLGQDDDVIERRQQWYGTAHAIISGIGDDVVRNAGTKALIGRRIIAGSGQNVSLRWISAARADAIFHNRLRECLPHEGDTSGEAKVDAHAQ